MKQLLLNITVIIFSISVFAGKNDVIDLGSLQVNGEVRQPPIRFYQPKMIPVSLVKNVSEMTFKSFEEELTRPQFPSQTIPAQKISRKKKVLK